MENGEKTSLNSAGSWRCSLSSRFCRPAISGALTTSPMKNPRHGMIPATTRQMITTREAPTVRPMLSMTSCQPWPMTSPMANDRPSPMTRA